MAVWNSMDSNLYYFILPFLYLDERVIYMSLYDILRADGSIVINKNLIHGIGLNEAILFSELLSREAYFESRNQLIDGYFFNTIDDLQSGTGIGEKPQRKAIAELKRLGLIKCILKGIPPKRYFKIIKDEDVLNKYLRKGKNKAESQRTSKFLPNGGIESDKWADLNLTFGRTNNTNINNTKEIILKNLYVVFSKNPEKPLVFFQKLFDYYLNKYEEYTGKEHPKLTIDKVIEITDNIIDFANSTNITNLRDYINMIDVYFRSNLDCDRNMLHFANESILYNRADNLNLTIY